MDRPDERFENDHPRAREGGQQAERARIERAADASAERELDWETEVDPVAEPPTGTTRPLAVTRGPGDDGPSAGDVAGEAVGGLTGVVTGAALGSAVGPVGTLIGGIAGALGGWWAGRAIAEAATTVTDEDEAWFRSDREAFGEAFGEVSAESSERARPAWELGRIAARNPEWSAREWDEVEPELRRGWSDDVARSHGDWSTASRWVAAGYRRERRAPGDEARPGG